MSIAMPHPHTPKAPKGRHVIEYLEFLTWNHNRNRSKKTGKNPIAQHLITTMEKPPHLTHEDVEALCQSIEEGKIPIKFDSPFDPDQHEKQ